MDTELTNDKLIAVWDPSSIEYEDPDDAYSEAEFEWECETGNIGAFLMREEFEHFYIEGHNMGWRNLEGYRTFSVKGWSNEERGADFVQEVVGFNAPMTFKLWDMGDHLYMKIWHHDSPMGESRKIWPAKACVFCGEVLTPEEQGTHEGDPVCNYCLEYKLDNEGVVV